MDVCGRISASALLSATRLFFVFVIFSQFLVFWVTAGHHQRDDDDDDAKEDRSDEEDRDYCENKCDYGCCESHQCCDPQDALPSHTVQVIAVAGASVVTLLLLFLCIMRYRMAARLSTSRTTRRNIGNLERGRSSTNTASSGCSSVCSGMSLNPPGSRGRLCPWSSLRTLMLLEESGLPTPSPWQTPRGGGVLLTPPPYTEHDPQGWGSERQLLPPPYDEVVKTAVETSTSSPSSSSSSSPPTSAATTAAADAVAVEETME